MSDIMELQFDRIILFLQSVSTGKGCSMTNSKPHLDTLTASPLQRSTKKKKLRTGARVALSVSITLLALLAISAAVVWFPLIRSDAWKTTLEEQASALPAFLKLMNTYEEKGVDAELEATLPRWLTDYKEELQLSASVSQSGGSKPRGILGISAIAGDSKLSGEVRYDPDQFSLGFGANECVSAVFPRKEIKAAMDGSVFAPDSGSAFALDPELYRELTDLFEQLDPADSPDAQKEFTEAILRVWKKWEKQLSRKTTLYVTQWSIEISRKTEYRAETKDLIALLELIEEELEKTQTGHLLFHGGFGSAENGGQDDLSAQLEQWKSEIREWNGTLILSDTVSKGRVTELYIRYEGKDHFDQQKAKDVTLTFSTGDEIGFDLTVGSESKDFLKEDTVRNAEKFSFRKEEPKWEKQRWHLDYWLYSPVNLSDETAEAHVVDRTRVLFETDDREHRYELVSLEGEDLEENFKMVGEWELDPARGIFRFSVDRIEAEDAPSFRAPLIKISVRTHDPANNIPAPEGAEVLSLDEKAFAEFVQTLPVQEAGRFAAVLVGRDPDVIYTLEGYPLYPADAYRRYEREYRGLYHGAVDELRVTGFPVPEAVYLYDENLQLYIIFSYSYYQSYFAYTLPEEIRATGHQAWIDENGKMVIHQWSQTGYVPPTCYAYGQRVYRCSICGQTEVRKIEILPHHLVWQESTAVVGGKETTVSTQCCTVCDSVLCMYFSGGGSVHFDFLGNGAHMISGYSLSEFYDWFAMPVGVSVPQNFRVVGFSDSYFVNHYQQGYRGVEIPEDITVLPSGTFENETEIQILIIPSTLTEIADGAFGDKNPLRRIYYCGTEAQWAQVKRNSYAELWANVEVVFAPNGVNWQEISELLISFEQEFNALADAKKLTDDIATAEELAKRDGIDLINTETVKFVAYDKENDLIAVCGAYNGTFTPIRIYSEDNQFLLEFLVEDNIRTLDIGSGYVALGSGSFPTVYLASAQTGEILLSYKVKLHPARADYISYIFIDGDMVISCAYDQFCEIDFYSITQQKHTRSRGSVHEPSMIIDKVHHRLGVLNEHISGQYFYLFDTRDGSELVCSQPNYYYSFSRTFEYNGTAFKVYHNESGREISTVYITLDGTVHEKTQGAPFISISSTADRLVSEMVLQTPTGSVAVCVNAEGKAFLLLSFDGYEEQTIEYYSDRVIVLQDGKFLLYTEGGQGILIVQLKEKVN